MKRSLRQGAGGTLPRMHMPLSPWPSISRGGNGMTNKWLARRNKSRTRGNAKKFGVNAGGTTNLARPCARRAELEHELGHNPDLYLFLCWLAGLAALLATLYECIQRRKPRPWKKAKPLGGLLRDRLSLMNKLRNRFGRRFTPGEVQRLEQRSRTRL